MVPTEQFEHPDGSARALLAELFVQAVESVRGDELIKRYSRLEGARWTFERNDVRLEWDIPAKGKVVVIGAGKAAASMAKGLESVLGGRIDRGCVIVKHGHVELLTKIRQIEAGHPIPDESGVSGTGELLDVVKGLTPDDRVFVLLSGGASALMVSPVAGVSLADKASVTSLLLRSGATIEEMNAVRRDLSRVKGGGLLRHIGAAESVTLLISDVPGDDLRIIGSGPTLLPSDSTPKPLRVLERYGLLDQVPEAVLARLRSCPDVPQKGTVESSRAESLLIGTSATLQEAVALQAQERGFELQIVDADMRGNTHEAAHRFAVSMKETRTDKPTLFMAAGETTLSVQGNGLGGRNQEFALVAAMELFDEPGLTLLAAGTDGTDGPTDAAGAFVDGQTCSRASALGIKPKDVLLNNDSYTLFKSLGDLLVCGPTGTNVMDLVLGISLPESTS